MDDSQSSDVFSNSEDYSCISPETVDTATYEILVSTTKTALSRNIEKDIHKPIFSTQFTTILENCNICVSQSLDLVIQMLASTDFQLSSLHKCIDDAVSLLQMLSNFTKSVVESISLQCSSMKTFPTTTGRILMAVFTHCKDSEIIYGDNLEDVEKQLKDLFRSCHELQLTYLMVLEKHFIFNLTEKEEQDVLLNAIDINLEIGEIVQSLDVKTMAEQWKAYTMICEKYVEALKDKHIYNNCTAILCKMIQNNLKNAVEIDQDEKIATRALKVTGFAIKIMIKICNIFKHTTSKTPEPLLEILLFIYLNNCAYLEYVGDKSEQFINLMTTNVLNPTDLLLKELLMDEFFVSCVLNLETNGPSQENKLLGYILLLVSTIKCIILQENIEFKISKSKLIDCIFRFLPHGHVWFNIGLKFKMEELDSSKQTYGLYEHVLTHMLMLAATLNCEEIIILEQKMYEAIFSIDCCSALFSSNLWTLLARLSSRQYLTSQVLYLCKIYKKMECHKMFSTSPQHIHLSYTMRELFAGMHSEDKIRIYNQFPVNDATNKSLWVVLKIGNLPVTVRNNIEELVMENLKTEFQKLFAFEFQISEEIYKLNNAMKLAATCSQIYDATLEDYIMKAWLKCCSLNIGLLPGDLDKGFGWYHNYIDGLVCVTVSRSYMFQNSVNLVKVLHVLANMVKKCKAEIKLLLVNMICKLSFISVNDQNEHVAYSLIVEIFKTLLHDHDYIVKNTFINVLRRHGPSKRLENIIYKHGDLLMQNTWSSIVNAKVNKDFKDKLLATMKLKYCHKCNENETVINLSDSVSVVEKTNSKNFDFADIDTLFEAASDSEPACKKVKLEINDVEEIISRLESDTVMLCNTRENINISQYKNRIVNICNRLKNIID